MIRIVEIRKKISRECDINSPGKQAMNLKNKYTAFARNHCMGIK